MATYGKIDEYDESEEWTQYVERMDHYFEANEIEEYDKKRSIFFSVLGAKTYKLVRGLTRPATPKDKTYKELTEIIKKHYVPKPSVIVQRYKFNIRVRKTGESISTFVAEVPASSEHCEFGNTLEEMLRDRLVCGGPFMGKMFLLIFKCPFQMAGYPYYQFVRAMARLRLKNCE